MRSVLEALRIPGAERPKLVDDPALAAAGRRGDRILAWRGVPEPGALSGALVQKQLEIGEQEPAPLLERNQRRRRAARGLGRLPEDPRIAQGTAADKDPRYPGRPNTRDDVT